MGRNAEEAMKLTAADRLEVLGFYRMYRLGVEPGGTFPVDALQDVRRVFGSWCALAVLDGLTDLATRRARQYAYTQVLGASPAVRHVHSAILRRRVEVGGLRGR